MNWFKRVILNWSLDNQKVEGAGISPVNPLLLMLGQSNDHHYITVPVENGFALITRTVEDPHSPYNPIGQRATVTFCPSAENLSQTIIAKMAQHKLAAR